MPDVLVNPYCSVADVQAEIKNAAAALVDEITRAINRASRWIDDWKARDYFLHDYSVTPLTLTAANALVSDGVLLLPHPGIVSLTEVLEGAGTLTEGVNYSVVYERARREAIGLARIGGGSAGGGGFINPYSTIGQEAPSSSPFGWALGYSTGQAVTLKGKFGYDQTGFVPVTSAGDTLNQLSNWVLTGLGTAVVFWQIATVSGTQARVRLFSDAAHASLIAEGTGLNASVVTLTAQNGSGVSGTVDMVYLGDDLDAANTLTPGTPVIDRTVVPAGIPQEIVWCALQIAAAFSGSNRKEVVGVDGAKESIIDRSIPKAVFDVLGRKGPILV